MTQRGRKYLESIIETQAEKIRAQEVDIISQKALITSLQSRILNHRCSGKNVIRQFFNLDVEIK